MKKDQLIDRLFSITLDSISSRAADILIYMSRRNCIISLGTAINIL